MAAEWMGWENVFHCEWNEFGQKVLKYYWPNAESFTDITKTDFTKYANRIDVLTGGFPCQPYSVAGKRKGKEDERHLWPEMLRAIKEIRPIWVVGENVFGLVNWANGLVFHEVQTDLEAAGYEVWPYVLPACGVNAPHRRDRIWFIAHARFERQAVGCEQSMGVDELRKQWFTPNPEYDGCNETENGQSMGTGNNSTKAGANEASEFTGHTEPCAGVVTYTERAGRQEQHAPCFAAKQGHNTGNGIERDAANTENFGYEKPWRTWNGRPRFKNRNSPTNWEQFPTQSPIRTRNDGFQPELDGITFSKWRNESIKAAGNAIVPPVAYNIFKAIEQYENL